MDAPICSDLFGRLLFLGILITLPERRICLLSLYHHNVQLIPVVLHIRRQYKQNIRVTALTPSPVARDYDVSSDV